MRGNVDGDIWLKQGVEERESFSGNVDSVVPKETSTGLFTKFGSPWWYLFVTQYGGRSVVVVLLKGFSLFCSDVGVEPKQSDVIFEMLCFESVGDVSGKVLLERSKGLDVGD